MSMKRAYACNLCRDEFPVDQMIGVYFTNMKDFHFDTASSTDGVHICKRCIPQLQVEIGKMKNPSIGEL
jgi:hypothetical protein